MKITIKPARAIMLLTIPLACLALALAISLLSVATSSEAQEKPPFINNKTTALRIMNLREGDGLVYFQLQNVSDQAISAYSIALGDGSRVDVDYAISGKFLFPGNIVEEQVSPDVQEKTEDLNRVIDVSAAIFADGTFDGAPAAAEYILRRREGLKLQFKRILPLMEAALKSSKVAMQDTLNSLKDTIEAFPARQGNNPPSATERGQHDAQEQTLSLLQTAMQKTPSDSNSVKREIGEIERIIKDWLSRL